jgi:hypothetical protein
MPGKVVVFDIETQDKICNMPGTDRDDQVCNLQVSCLSYLVLDADKMLDPEEAAVEVERASMVTLWRDEDPDGTGPFEQLFKAFDDAELVVSYNGLGFDHLVLFKHCRRGRSERHLLKTHDAFARLRCNTRVWFKLDNLLKANGLETKTANGLEAITMWSEGRREELKVYCEQDVRALARLLCLPELQLPNTTIRVPNYVFGIASAVAASRTSKLLSLKRKLEDLEEEPSTGAVVEVKQ